MAAPRILVVVLAGGEGRRLAPLTTDRAKPAVPFGGSYRIIDFVLSNFANAGYLKIVVLTQYKSHSLDRHISQTWRFSTLLGNYVTPVPAQMRRGPQWFSGSADAVYQNLNLISDEKPDYVCVFGADHIYHMDPRQMVAEHIESGAGVTVAAIPVPIDEAPSFGIIHADADNRIVEFLEKPQDPPPMPGDPTKSLASMGNYVFTTQALVDVVTPLGDDSGPTDIGGDVIPALTRAGVARMYDFSKNTIPGQADHERGYWRDVGSLDAYYEANMDLLAPVPPFSLYNKEWPVYSLQLPLPPAKLGHGWGGEDARVVNSLLCAGSIVSGGIVDRSILSPDVFVDSSAVVTESILFPGVTVGHGAKLHRCVIDKNVVVPPGYQIGFDPVADAERFTISDRGIVVVEKDRLLT
ncbi:MAG: glucose-1-phosphate adenylyltransferase [Actinobacteria bacterium]|nr:glucose-1-phosphate adenylyltransferase [Actinomycetota bacterium]